jgi:PPOX class probable F420-dependent enzyme
VAVPRSVYRRGVYVYTVAKLEPELRRRVANARVARLATVRPDGQPHVVPITFVANGDEIASAVDYKPKTTTDLQRLRNLDANPSASVIVDHWDEDWSRLWWVRGDGAARVVTSGADWDDAVGLLSEKYAPYRETPPRGPVIFVRVDRWVSWSP